MLCAPYYQCFSVFSLFSLLPGRPFCQVLLLHHTFCPYHLPQTSLFLHHTVVIQCGQGLHVVHLPRRLLDSNMIHCFHQQLLARTVRTLHLHKPVVWILTDPNF